MNSTIVAFVALAALAAVVSAQSGPALENVDVDNVLKNEKLVRRYIDCTLDRGRCEQNGRDLKGKYLLQPTASAFTAIFYITMPFCCSYASPCAE